MKRFITIFSLCLCLAAPIQAVLLQVDPTESYIKFTIHHIFGIPVQGEFGAFSVAVKLEENAFTAVEAKIDSNSVNTKNKTRDRRLKRKQFFDARQHSDILFKADTPINANATQITGILFIKDRQHPMTIPVKIQRKQDPTTKKQSLIIEANNFTLSRKSIGITGHRYLIRDNVTVKAKLLLKPYK